MGEFLNSVAARIKPASRMLQSLTGVGRVKKEIVDRAEEMVESVSDRLDLKDFLAAHIEEVQACLADVKAGQKGEDTVEKLAASFANFRANAGTFSRDNIIELSTVILRWLESIEKVDRDVRDVLLGYISTMDAVLKGHSFKPKEVELIAEELNNACQRYFAKHPELTLYSEMTNTNAFYINETNISEDKIDTDLDAELDDDALIEK